LTTADTSVNITTRTSVPGSDADKKKGHNMSANEPLYRQLASTLKERITGGEYAFGDALPSEQAMAKKYGISHLTVRKALDVLAGDGLILRVQGKGTYVKAPRVLMDMKMIEGFTSFLQKKGVRVTNEVLHVGLRKAKHKYAKIFGIEEDDEVFECARLRLGNGIPMAVEYNAVPAKYAEDLPQYDYMVYSLHDVYVGNGIRIKSEHQILEVVKATNPHARLLNLNENDEVFLLTSHSTDETGRILEYTRIYNSDERIVFSATAD